MSLEVGEAIELTLEVGKPVNLGGMSAGLGIPIVPAGGDLPLHYRHTQSSPLAEWTIVHNLGYPPGGITVQESTGDFITFGMESNTATQTVISFGAPTAGTADLS